MSIEALPIIEQPTTPRESAVTSWWVAAAQRFMQQRISVIAAAGLLLLVLAALAAPLLAQHDPSEQFRKDGLTAAGLPVGPSAQFWLGTDGLGRDMFSRMLYGARVSLGIGIVASCLSVLIGVLVGGSAGMAGGRIDTLLMRFVDLALSLPTLFIILLFVTIFKPSLWITIAVITLLGWAYPSRIFRAEVLGLREREFVTAARCLGLNKLRIFTHHVLPQILPLIVIYVGLGVPGAIFAEAGLGFLGLGVPPPAPSWGGMINTGTLYYRSSPLQIILPGLAIVATVVCFNLVSSGLRDALDPTVREK